MSEIKLKPCPFCGGLKLRIEMKKKHTRHYFNGKMLENYTTSVRCNICHARGSAVSGWVINRKYVDENEWLEDEIEIGKLQAMASEAWNRRDGAE